ncbi:AraC family transcriptional regulator [Puia sp.]|uniref:helix-turn-helix transcriptional regulator n=1 Tax=Puia sp. TaxID=2045100 RepID=UPI002F3FC037
MPIASDVYKKIVTAKLYIDGNFTEPIDLDRLSREACLSRYHFHRLFTRIYQLTPHQYLTRKRIEQARQCLAANELTVTEICNEVGFESIGSFSTLFKKEIGHAPAHYRVRAHELRRQTLTQPRSFIPHCFIENCAADSATINSKNQEASADPLP